MARAKVEVETEEGQQGMEREGNNALKPGMTSQSRRVSKAPIFKRHHESSRIELLYDLFIVANLSIFSEWHYADSVTHIKSYLGFFSLMWFTWLQTSLFDVRFSSDSVVNRVCKAVSFGVMTGFSIASSQYNPDLLSKPADDLSNPYKSFRALALVLMASRLMLGAQYGLVLYYLKDYPRTFAPLLSTIAVLFIASMGYLVTFFFFSPGENKHAYLAWYGFSVVEAIIVITISCLWRVVSFKYTHLIERIGLLTLIIMGEGIIGITRSISEIVNNTNIISANLIGTIIAAGLLIYFIWVLYFDQIENNRFGTIHQQIWALLHFPLHSAILLTVEGVAFLILWIPIADSINWLSNNFWIPAPGISASAYVRLLEQSLTNFDNLLRGKNISNYTAEVSAIAKLNFSDSNDLTKAYNTATGIFTDLVGVIFTNFDVKPPENINIQAQSANDNIDISEQEKSDIIIFLTVYVYYLIASGVFLFTLGVMYWFGKNHKSRWEYASVAVRMLVGAGLASLTASYMHATTVYLLISPWMIPLVAIVYFIVITVDNILVWLSNSTMAHSLKYRRSGRMMEV